MSIEAADAPWLLRAFRGFRRQGWFRRASRHGLTASPKASKGPRRVPQHPHRTCKWNLPAFVKKKSESPQKLTPNVAPYVRGGLGKRTTTLALLATALQ